MKHLYLKMLWFLSDIVDMQALDLFKNGYGNMEFKYNGKSYRLSIVEENEEETTNGN